MQITNKKSWEGMPPDPPRGPLDRIAPTTEILVYTHVSEK